MGEEVEVVSDCYTVHDTAGLLALPTGTRLTEAAEEGAHLWEIAGPEQILYVSGKSATTWWIRRPLPTHWFPFVVENPSWAGLTAPAIGDTAEVQGREDGFEDWAGLVGVVTGFNHRGYPVILPKTCRPDGYGYTPFSWPQYDLEKVA